MYRPRILAPLTSLCDEMVVLLPHMTSITQGPLSFLYAHLGSNRPLPTNCALLQPTLSI